jgi:nucleotide-binding universal stress UspA family protein
MAEMGAQLDRMATLAQTQGARLRLAYAGDGSEGPLRPLSRLRQRARYLGRRLGRPVETLAVELRGCEALRRAVEQADWVGIAKPAAATNVEAGTRRLLRALLGLCPLLLIGPGEPRPYANVLVPVSLGGGSRALLRWADALAPSARLELLHVTELPSQLSGALPSAPPSVLDEVWRQAWSALQRRLQTVGDGLGGEPDESLRGLSYRFARGGLLRAVQDCQRHAGHELVVVGCRAPRAGWDWLRPRLAQRLAARLDCDLLVLPQPAPGISPTGWLGSLLA